MNLMKEIIELSLHMISLNLSFFPSLTGGPNFSVLNSLTLTFFLLSIFSFFFLIPSTVLFPYIVTLMMQRDLSNAAITQTHRTVVHGKGMMAKNCFSWVILLFLFLVFFSPTSIPFL
jgi:hypothetical protein